MPKHFVEQQDKLFQDLFRVHYKQSKLDEILT